MIETTMGVLASVLGALVIGLLAGAVVMGLKKAAPAPPPHRDTCVHGCGVVHGIMCQHGTIIEGFPLYCERAYGHGGPHEASFIDGSRCWPNRETGTHAPYADRPPFKKMIL